LIKKTIVLVAVLIMSLFLVVGCNRLDSTLVDSVNETVGSVNEPDESVSEAAVTKEATFSEDTKPEPTEVPTQEETDPVAEPAEVDVDLTQMGSNMVYAEVYNMMATPEMYMDKTIKVRGDFISSYYDVTDDYYFFVLVKDAMACCAQGIEFIWDEGSHVYPDEYPDENAIIEITGVFKSYDELDITYNYLDVISLEVIQ